MISIGYLAGFIDGEGCFSAHATQKASPSATIVNTDIDILDEMADTIELLSGIRPNPKSRYLPQYPNSKPCYTLRLGPPILRILLPLIIPELRVKRFQAETMLELINMIRPRTEGHSLFQGTEHWRKRQELVYKICWANQGCP